MHAITFTQYSKEQQAIRDAQANKASPAPGMAPGTRTAEMLAAEYAEVSKAPKIERLWDFFVNGIKDEVKEALRPKDSDKGEEYAPFVAALINRGLTEKTAGVMYSEAKTLQKGIMSGKLAKPASSYKETLTLCRKVLDEQKDSRAEQRRNVKLGELIAKHSQGLDMKSPDVMTMVHEQATIELEAWEAAADPKSVDSRLNRTVDRLLKDQEGAPEGSGLEFAKDVARALVARLGLPFGKELIAEIQTAANEAERIKLELEQTKHAASAQKAAEIQRTGTEG